MKIWDSKSPKPRQTLAVTGVSANFSADSKWLMINANGTFQALELASGRIVREIAHVYAGGVGQAVAFSPDGRMLAIAYAPHTVRFLDTKTWREQAALELPNPAPLHALQFSADSQHIAVVSQANLVELWDLQMIRQQLQQLKLDWDLPQYAPRPQQYYRPLHLTVASEQEIAR